MTGEHEPLGRASGDKSLLNYITGKNLVRQAASDDSRCRSHPGHWLDAGGRLASERTAQPFLERAMTVKYEVEKVNEMRLANANLVLAAMDTIIDRGEGSIQPERIEIINAATATLAVGSATLKAIAAEAGAADQVSTYDQDLNTVTRAIKVDLKRMVENGAPEADYAAVDDAIDGAGERVGTTLNNVSALGGNIVAERVTEATQRSAEALRVQRWISDRSPSSPSSSCSSFTATRSPTGSARSRAACSASSTATTMPRSKARSGRWKSATWPSPPTSSDWQPSRNRTLRKAPAASAFRTKRSASAACPRPKRIPAH